ncbi:uncharacterized protein DUF2511 [Actinocorallia herbida]|uniref:Uncharacterized protein DUF2511 n=1 Tax=Actinocorallia herbida TaxID=58109 RepID=A0A3N1D1B7_9ACTN|nr:DUF2511 domain-containing protein [Actinocorallia herbida]ROO87314.1 uncharacterized protein DUF2511 [Actinocorallia herbida]
MKLWIPLLIASSAMALSGCGLLLAGTGEATSAGSVTLLKGEVDPWPFTVEEGDLACEDEEVTFTVDGTTYGLNDAARRHQPDPAPIQADDPQTPGTKISLEHVITEGLAFCGNDDASPQPPTPMPG